MHKIVRVEALERYEFNLTFEDGVSGTVDLSELVGNGVFALWDRYDEFRKAGIGDMGELVWSDEVDLCPDSLYLQVTGKRPEEVFPGLTKELPIA
jgi:hypothetical protein